MFQLASLDLLRINRYTEFRLTAVCRFLGIALYEVLACLGEGKGLFWFYDDS